jgi:tetratricopeptide (TPR) repeat protein
MTRQDFIKYISHPAALVAALVLLTVAMYGPFLHNPIVFDDINFFDGGVKPYYQSFFKFSSRWIPYASFEWTRALLGDNIVWYRSGNLALHAAVAVTLFFFLRNLFEAVMPQQPQGIQGSSSFSSGWMAFYGALVFALHPAAVYAAAYLIQRSILLATLLVLAMWTSLLQGIVRRNFWWLIASAIFYFFAALSKEHAITAPAVALALLLLLRKPDMETLKKFGPIFLIYGAIAVYVVISLRYNAGPVIGQAYEPSGPALLGRLAARDPGFDLTQALPLSMLTQGLLFFKYFLIWILPNPLWMSVDMFEPFAPRLWSWPHVAGSIAFLLYGVGAARLLLKRGKYALLGFALLCPWLMFATELSTVRIQETFVIYRSYLWIPGLLAGLPLLFQKLPPRRAPILLIVLLLGLLPITWGRLTTFSAPLLLWNDAARLIDDKDGRPGVERVYHNRGLHLLKTGYPELALKDFDKAISLLPTYVLAMNDRGAAYLTLQKYPQALADFSQVLKLAPDYGRSILGRALTYEGMGNQQAALQDYARLCMLGAAVGCNKMEAFAAKR